MNVTCEKCGKRYVISDEKLAGKTSVKIRCKQCQNLISVAVAKAHAEEVAAPLASHSAHPVHWFAMLSGKQVGPFDVEELRKRIASDEITPRTYLWHAGMDGWKRAAEVDEVSLLLKGLKVQSQPPPPPPPPKAPRQDVALATEEPIATLVEHKAAAPKNKKAAVAEEPNDGDEKTRPYAKKLLQDEPSYNEHAGDTGAVADPFAAISHNDGKQAPPPGEATRFFIAQAGVHKRNPPWKIALFVMAFIGGPLAIIYILNTFEIVKLPTVTRTDEDGEEVQESFFSAGGAAGLRDLLTGNDKQRKAQAEKQRRAKEALIAARVRAANKNSPEDEPEVVKPQVQDQALSDFYNEAPSGKAIKVRNKYENDGTSGTAVNTAGLSREAISKVIADKSRAFQTCIDNALRRNPKLAVGSITVSLAVGPSGAVKSAGIEPKKHEGSDWGQCMMSTGRRIIFPRSDAETQVELPFKVGVALAP